MGALQAMEMADRAPSREVALRWHLTSNHYLAVSPQFIDPAKEAIDRAVRATILEDETIWQSTIELPNGNVVTVAQIIDGLHLNEFVQHDIEAAFAEEAEDDDE